MRELAHLSEARSRRARILGPAYGARSYPDAGKVPAQLREFAPRPSAARAACWCRDAAARGRALSSRKTAGRAGDRFQPRGSRRRARDPRAHAIASGRPIFSRHSRGAFDAVYDAHSCARCRPLVWRWARARRRAPAGGAGLLARGLFLLRRSGAPLLPSTLRSHGRASRGSSRAPSSAVVDERFPIRSRCSPARTLAGLATRGAAAATARQ